MRQILTLLFLLLLSLQNPVQAARHALVVGNDNYTHVTPLKNARADARAMAKALESAGFKVKLAIDLNRAGMNLALRQFKTTLSGGDEAIFYFAGHGVQLGGTNYLLPTDLQDADEEQIKDDAVQLQRVLEDLAEKQVRFSLAIIDACRDNPFKGAGRNLSGRGLAPTTAANGQMIIFSAGAGQKALDSLGQSDRSQNGLFTRVFVKEIEKPGLPIHDSLRNVREEVVALAKGVGHDQVPAIYDQSIGKFYFRKGEPMAEPSRPLPAVVAPPAVQPAPEEHETPAATGIKNPPTRSRLIDDQAALWEAVERGNTVDDYDAYLRQYPKGRYASLAKTRKASLKEQAEQAEQQAELDAWQLAEQGATPDSYNAYLERYPGGKFAQLAKARAKKLKEDKSWAEEHKTWQYAEQKGRAKDFQAYLERYPNGRYAAAAKTKLTALSKKGNDEESAAQKRELEKKKALEKPIRTVAVLQIFNQSGLRFTNRTINPFSLAGKLINRSERKNLTETLDKEIGSMNPTIASQIQLSLENALARGGLSLINPPDSGADAGNPSKVDYGKLKTTADALIHVYLSDVGLISTTFADAFEPRIEVTFCFIRPIQGEKCLEKNEVIFGGGIKKDDDYELRAAPEHRWATEEDLIAQVDKVKDAMSNGAIKIGELIGDRIVKSQALRKQAAAN